jgi:predicted NBD/HSP70 family sugar kinase
VLGLLGLPTDRRTRIDNVATLSAQAETVRGQAQHCGTVLYLHAATGLGGALTLDGVPARGRRGFAGEYGHLPFGRRDYACRCGLRGCWETEVDQLALARAAGLTADVQTAATAAATVFAQAAHGDVRARQAVDQVAANLGRGLGALITVHDPDLVVLSGHAADLLAVAPHVVEAEAVAGGLPAHRDDPPPIEASRLGENSALIGAAEAVFDQLIDDVVPLSEPWGLV